MERVRIGALMQEAAAARRKDRAGSRVASPRGLWGAGGWFEALYGSIVIRKYRTMGC